MKCSFCIHDFHEGACTGVIATPSMNYDDPPAQCRCASSKDPARAIRSLETELVSSLAKTLALIAVKIDLETLGKPQMGGEVDLVRLEESDTYSSVIEELWPGEPWTEEDPNFKIYSQFRKELYEQYKLIVGKFGKAF